MIAQKDPYIKSAYNQLQIISQDEQKRMEYEARQKAILDHNQFVYEAEQRGMNRINRLNTKLIQNKRLDDLERSANDAAFQQQLMSEYGI